jgi:hypothetical protein
MYRRIRDLVSLLTGNRRRETVARRTTALATPPPKCPRASPFVLDSVYAGIPYKVIDTGAIDALIAGKIVRFKNADSFLASANCEGIELRLRPFTRGAARPSECV